MKNKLQHILVGLFLPLLVVSSLFIPGYLQAAEVSCTAYDIVKVEIFFRTDDNSSLLASDVMVTIEGAAFFIPTEQIKGYWNAVENGVHRFRLLARDKTGEKTILRLSTDNNRGEINLDWLGVHLRKTSMTCSFEGMFILD